MSEDKQRAIEALEKAGYKPYPHERNLWIKYHPDLMDEDKVKLYGSYDDPGTGICKATLSVDMAALPALLAPGYAAEQAKAAVDVLVTVCNLNARTPDPNGQTRWNNQAEAHLAGYRAALNEVLRHLGPVIDSLKRIGG